MASLESALKPDNLNDECTDQYAEQKSSIIWNYVNYAKQYQETAMEYLLLLRYNVEFKRGLIVNSLLFFMGYTFFYLISDVNLVMSTILFQLWIVFWWIAAGMFLLLTIENPPRLLVMPKTDQHIIFTNLCIFSMVPPISLFILSLLGLVSSGRLWGSLIQIPLYLIVEDFILYHSIPVDLFKRKDKYVDARQLRNNIESNPLYTYYGRPQEKVFIILTFILSALVLRVSFATCCCLVPLLIYSSIMKFKEIPRKSLDSLLADSIEKQQQIKRREFLGLTKYVFEDMDYTQFQSPERLLATKEKKIE